jgi:hypothetical protein
LRLPRKAQRFSGVGRRHADHQHGTVGIRLGDDLDETAALVGFQRVELRRDAGKDDAVGAAAHDVVDDAREIALGRGAVGLKGVGTMGKTPESAVVIVAPFASRDESGNLARSLR